MQKILIGFAGCTLGLAAALGIWFPRYRMKWKGSTVVTGPVSCAGFALFFFMFGVSSGTLDVVALKPYRLFFCLASVAGMIVAIIGGKRDEREYRRSSKDPAPLTSEKKLPPVLMHTKTVYRPVSRYNGVVATGLWTLGWMAETYQAIRYVGTSGSGAATLNLVVASVCSALGLAMTIRIIRRMPNAHQQEKLEAPETGLRRLTGWLAVLVWCAAAVGWNLAVYGSVLRAIVEAHAGIVLLLIPFSLIGWVLLNLLTVCIGVTIDDLIQHNDD